MNSQSYSQSTGTHAEVKLSGTVSIPGVADVSAETAVQSSLMFSSTDESMQAKGLLDRGYQSSFTKQRKATAYKVEMDWEAKPV